MRHICKKGGLQSIRFFSPVPRFFQFILNSHELRNILEDSHNHSDYSALIPDRYLILFHPEAIHPIIFKIENLVYKRLARFENGPVLLLHFSGHPLSKKHFIALTYSHCGTRNPKELGHHMVDPSIAIVPVRKKDTKGHTLQKHLQGFSFPVKHLQRRC